MIRTRIPICPTAAPLRFGRRSLKCLCPQPVGQPIGAAFVMSLGMNLTEPQGLLRLLCFWRSAISRPDRRVVRQVDQGSSAAADEPGCILASSGRKYFFRRRLSEEDRGRGGAEPVVAILGDKGGNLKRNQGTVGETQAWQGPCP